MKERLVQLLDLEQITPSKFADIIGVQRSSISHVISGRNKPSFDFLQKTLKAFPGLNAEWLILGEGTMYEQMGRGAGGTLFDAPPEPSEAISGAPDPDNDPTTVQTEPYEEPSAVSEIEVPGQQKDEDPDPALTDQDTVPDAVAGPGAKRNVVQVMVLYDDDTFRSFRPSS